MNRLRTVGVCPMKDDDDDSDAVVDWMGQEFRLDRSEFALEEPGGPGSELGRWTVSSGGHGWVFGSVFEKMLRCDRIELGVSIRGDMFDIE
jgi:hypothetical protein